MQKLVRQTPMQRRQRCSPEAWETTRSLATCKTADLKKNSNRPVAPFAMVHCHSLGEFYLS